MYPGPETNCDCTKATEPVVIVVRVNRSDCWERPAIEDAYKLVEWPDESAAIDEQTEHAEQVREHNHSDKGVAPRRGLATRPPQPASSYG